MTRRLCALLLVAAAACDPSAPPSAGHADAGPSPSASVVVPKAATERLPVPEAGGPGDPGAGLAADPPTAPDGGPPPESMVPATPIPAEQAATQPSVAGLTLDAVFRWRDVPAPPKAPEVNLEGIREAQKLTALTLTIELSETGRMRAELTARAFPLPAHAEIRARTDHFGHVILWPNSSQYRVIPPGSLRSTLGERRVDVMPLVAGTVGRQTTGKRLGVATRNVEVSSPIGTLRLELGKVPEVGEGGMLLCRSLVEMIGVDPKSPVCQPGEVPLLGAFGWQEGGGITFEATTLGKRSDLMANAMLVPPPGAKFVPTGLPAVPQGIFLTREEVAAMRSSALHLPPNRDPGVPGEGFVAANFSDREMYLLVDGVPVVAVPANADRYVIGSPRGRYLVQWRSFLGEKVLPSQTVTMPARIVYGSAPDAGAPDGG